MTPVNSSERNTLCVIEFTGDSCVWISLTRGHILGWQKNECYCRAQTHRMSRCCVGRKPAVMLANRKTNSDVDIRRFASLLFKYWEDLELFGRGCMKDYCS